MGCPIRHADARPGRRLAGRGDIEVDPPARHRKHGACRAALPTSPDPPLEDLGGTGEDGDDALLAFDLRDGDVRGETLSRPARSMTPRRAAPAPGPGTPSPAAIDNDRPDLESSFDSRAAVLEIDSLRLSRIRPVGSPAPSTSRREHAASGSLPLLYDGTGIISVAAIAPLRPGSVARPGSPGYDGRATAPPPASADPATGTRQGTASPDSAVRIPQPRAPRGTRTRGVEMGRQHRGERAPVSGPAAGLAPTDGGSA
jgi:hypothetical protein